ncbi:ABC transporter ATP-binding protein [Flexithrix dorotheae]|uniref:ABC transporter ATP-binding protein n=1 Tax=Flexithrix dorotheae TaxID=70993 RepID=UPI00036C4837|nr:ABC transporter ATP-binding protein [Flexithrix dorotheae]
MVEIRNLNFSYKRKQHTLRDLSLSIPAGSIFAFVGENGAGKSTTLKHIVGLIPELNHKIEVFGKSLRTHRKEIVQKVGVMIESPSFYPFLSGYDNLKIHCLYRKLPLERIEKVTRKVGLSEHLRKKYKAYSMGMKQQLGLALTLLADPDLYVLDEPMNGLDPTRRIAFRNLLLDLHKKGKTILLSSHHLPEVELIATDIGIIKNGSILFQGSMESLRSLKQKNQSLHMEVSDVGQTTSLLEKEFEILLANTKSGKLEIGIKDRENIPLIVQRLTANGIAIYKLNGNEKSLEELFMDSISTN